MACPTTSALQFSSAQTLEVRNCNCKDGEGKERQIEGEREGQTKTELKQQQEQQKKIIKICKWIQSRRRIDRGQSRAKSQLTSTTTTLCRVMRASRRTSFTMTSPCAQVFICMCVCDCIETKISTKIINSICCWLIIHQEIENAKQSKQIVTGHQVKNNENTKKPKQKMEKKTCFQRKGKRRNVR